MSLIWGLRVIVTLFALIVGNCSLIVLYNIVMLSYVCFDILACY